ncbi:hypothetical protein SM764_07920 [Pseudophaeobacter sp. 1A16562]
MSLDSENPSVPSLPDNFQSGSDGYQKDSTTSPPLNITRSNAPQHPVGGVLNGIADAESRSLGNSAATKLAAASFEEVHRQLHQANLHLDQERTARITAEKDVVRLQAGIKSKKTVDVVAAFTLMAGPFLISQGIDLSAETDLITEAWMVALGAVALAIGLFVQLAPWNK